MEERERERETERERERERESMSHATQAASGKFLLIHRFQNEAVGKAEGQTKFHSLINIIIITNNVG